MSMGLLKNLEKMSLINQINELRNSPIKEIVEQRLKEFESFKNKQGEEWFSELCFCLLTANSRASTAMRIQEQIGSKGFLKSPKENISYVIRQNKHRFHNNKARYIVEARKFEHIKAILSKMPELQAREFLVENVKGLGYKEASHFLRNTGSKGLAILDRHILNLMAENDYLKEKPKTLSKKTYLKIEEKFNSLAKYVNMTSAELDLYMWYLKTNKVLK